MMYGCSARVSRMAAADAPAGDKSSLIAGLGMGFSQKSEKSFDEKTQRVCIKWFPFCESPEVASIMFYKNDETIETSDRVRVSWRRDEFIPSCYEAELAIHTASDADSAVYSCEISCGGVSERSDKHLQLDGLSFPRILHLNISELPGEMGIRLSFECFSALPCTVEWRREGVVVGSDFKRTLVWRALGEGRYSGECDIKSPIFPQEVGEFTCTVTTSGGSITAPFHVDTGYREGCPEPEEGSATIMQTMSNAFRETMLMMCNIRSQSTIQSEWYMNNVLLPADQRRSMNVTAIAPGIFQAVLCVLDFTVADAGLYKCRVSNECGTSLVKFDAVVLEQRHNPNVASA